LEEEGIVFSDEGRVNLKRYGWDPARDLSQEQVAEIFKEADQTPELPGPRLMSIMERDLASPFRKQGKA